MQSLLGIVSFNKFFILVIFINAFLGLKSVVILRLLKVLIFLCIVKIRASLSRYTTNAPTVSAFLVIPGRLLRSFL